MPPSSPTFRDEPPSTEEAPLRYLDLPGNPPARPAQRNLVLGSVGLVGAGLLFGWAVHLAGDRAAATVLTCLATVALLYVCARARVLRQRNGTFFAIAMVCLLGSLMALAEYGLRRASAPAGLTPAKLTVTTPPLSPLAEAKPLPGAKAPEGDTLSAVPPPANAASPGDPPSLIEAFRLAPPDPQARQFRVKRNQRVDMADGKSYLIRSGDAFALVGEQGDDVYFVAGDQEVLLPKAEVEISGKPAVAPVAAPETAAQITSRAQREAIRRYPGIAVKDSPENSDFVKAVNDLKKQRADDFFQEPSWPLRLAESLAQRQGWKRAGASDGSAGEGEMPAPPGGAVQ